jgi:hypothetical protein
MRITIAVLASIVTMELAVPALAQGFAGCPPGLAMKGNGCLPPGQAKKMMRERASPPVAYVPDYYRRSPDYPRSPDYYPRSGGSLNLGVTVPLP